MADFPSVKEDGASIEIAGLNDNDDDMAVLYTLPEHCYDTDGVPSCGVASSSSRHKPLEEAPHNPLEEAPHNPLEEAPHNPLEEAPHNPLEEAPHNPLKEAPHNRVEEAPQYGNVYQSTSSLLPQVMDRGSASEEESDRIIKDILRSLTNTEMPHYKFYVRENKAVRRIHMKMKDNILFVERNRVIYIEVEGAQAGQIVTVEQRYMAGAHENVPVYACGIHVASTDPHYSFCVPKLSSVHKEMDRNGHLSLKIPVPNPPAENGNSFTFPLMFRCWNSCHKDHGRDQEIILKLSDQQNVVLKETNINLRVCAGVLRDFKKYMSLKEERQEQGSKRCPEEKTKGPALKKAKWEVVEGGEGRQAGEAETPPPLPLLSPRQDEGLCVCQVKCDRASLPALKEFIEKQRQTGSTIEMVVDGPDPPPNME
ncbi:uncharacterized protein LOC126985380 isoform X2 [Eriocheir sinensis]|uniref:uncharacterized protein LOC126985380 isoform X2 n=1 Tax=Eriocheir sinensis TaxID=95602 RepID=UPI0021CA171A|nr:uncharacterized protein LOC126985380 isoform X2 [Eriocheir sinensis]XP_050696131.1 uncharacterized protein LOC126985380 isoform X2 [Eriocheir sinensis]XP_050696132.1 uncharacterized protein LOC126985380 isoform X2 [Eriocheir sinensis]